MMFLRRWAMNRADILLGFAVFILMMIAAAIAICSDTVWSRLMGAGTDGKLVVALLTGWLTILLAGVGGAIKITSTRQSLTRLFRSEIKALQFGLLTMDMFEFWRKLNRICGCTNRPVLIRANQQPHGAESSVRSTRPVSVDSLPECRRGSARIRAVWRLSQNPLSEFGLRLSTSQFRVSLLGTASPIRSSW